MVVEKDMGQLSWPNTNSGAQTSGPGTSWIWARAPGTAAAPDDCGQSPCNRRHRRRHRRPGHLLYSRRHRPPPRHRHPRMLRRRDYRNSRPSPQPGPSPSCSGPAYRGCSCSAGGNRIRPHRRLLWNVSSHQRFATDGPRRAKAALSTSSYKSILYKVRNCTIHRVDKTMLRRNYW